MNVQVKNSERRWTLFALSLAGVLLSAGVLLWVLPDQRGLTWLGLYTIPSHMFVSPFPHEPVLFYYAKIYPAWGCAFASLIGCLVAGLWDYCVVVPFVHHERVRAKYVHTGLYKQAVVWFRRSPFWVLVIFGLTPIPFYPVKFLSMADGYPLGRYEAALLVGRAPRYYLLAYLGRAMNLPNWSLVALALAIVAVALYNDRKNR